MTDKTEAQPEALRLELHQECADFATSLRSAANVIQLQGREAPPSFLKAADLFEQAAAEIQQLKAQNARLQPTIEDDSQEWAKCDPAIAFHLIERHSDNWADAGKMMTEFADAKAEVKLKALREELTTQTNRAAAAEQQVTALTQRLDTANALNTDAREQLAQVQAAPIEGWKLVPVEPTEDMFVEGMEADCAGMPSVDDDRHVRSIWNAMLAASPQPPGN